MRVRGQQGFSLLELIIVISIIGLLAIVLGMQFQGWIARYRVENQMRNMYDDILNARARALTRTRMHFVNFPTGTSYSLFEDDASGAGKVVDGNELLNPGGGANDDTVLAGSPKTLESAIVLGDDAGNVVAFPVAASFSKRGLIAPVLPVTLTVPFTVCAFTTVDPDYDCITVSETRVVMGKIQNQGGLCDSANCQEK